MINCDNCMKEGRAVEAGENKIDVCFGGRFSLIYRSKPAHLCGPCRQKIAKEIKAVCSKMGLDNPPRREK